MSITARVVKWFLKLLNLNHNKPRHAHSATISNMLNTLSQVKEYKMSKFKVGDKVRVIQKGHRQFGQVASIVKDDKSNCYQYSLDVPNSDVFGDRELELVTSDESELERLVRVANEGLDAMATLKYDYSNKVQWHTGTMYDPHLFPSRIQIKSKPKFEPFVVGSGWTVKLEGETLHVGCQQFDSKRARGMLSFLLNNGKSWSYGNTDYHSCRKGISNGRGDILEWSDADKILAALQQAGV
jgi:hypothetical protein